MDNNLYFPFVSKQENINTSLKKIIVLTQTRPAYAKNKLQK